MIDNIAKRYGLLPTEVMQRASTFDMVILDAAVGYEQYLTDKARGVKKVPEVPQEKLLDIVKKHKGKGDTK